MIWGCTNTIWLSDAKVTFESVIKQNMLPMTGTARWWCRVLPPCPHRLQLVCVCFLWVSSGFLPQPKHMQRLILLCRLGWMWVCMVFCPYISALLGEAPTTLHRVSDRKWNDGWTIVTSQFTLKKNHLSSFQGSNQFLFGLNMPAASKIGFRSLVGPKGRSVCTIFPPWKAVVYERFKKIKK